MHFFPCTSLPCLPWLAGKRTAHSVFSEKIFSAFLWDDLSRFAKEYLLLIFEKMMCKPCVCPKAMPLLALSRTAPRSPAEQTVRIFQSITSIKMAMAQSHQCKFQTPAELFQALAIQVRDAAPFHFDFAYLSHLDITF